MRTASARGITRHAAAASVLLSAGLLASACGSAHPGQPASSNAATPAAAASTTPPAPATPSASATPASATAGCSAADLRVTVDTAQSGGAAGSIYYPIDFVNTSSRTCTMYGYPGVSFVTAPSGSQIGQAAARNPTATATTVTLAAGASAHATLQVAEAGNYTPSQCNPVTAHWLRVYPPGSYSADYAKFTTQVCSGTLPAKIGKQLSVFVVLPGAGKAGQP